MNNCCRLAVFMAILCALSSVVFAKSNIKTTTPNAEVVEAEGMGPIVKGDITAAKQSSLHDALKNALGLVIGVYVSQEALVQKAMLIEDNITSQTEGYIERYEIVNETRDENFYKTKIRAQVRKEDLSAKLKALELEPKKLGNPVVKFLVTELMDGQPAQTKYADNELKNSFVSQGFVVSDSGAADIQVIGTAESKFNTDANLGGLISYRGIVSIKVIKGVSEDVVTTANMTAGGVDVTKDAAAKNAVLNAVKKMSTEMPGTVLRFLKERGTVQLRITNIDSLNILNDFTKAVRALIEVRDCLVRNYADGTAVIDLDLKKSNAGEVSKRLEQMSSFKVKVNKTGAYDINAEIE